MTGHVPLYWILDNPIYAESSFLLQIALSNEIQWIRSSTLNDQLFSPFFLSAPVLALSTAHSRCSEFVLTENSQWEFLSHIVVFSQERSLYLYVFELEIRLKGLVWKNFRTVWIAVHTVDSNWTHNEPGAQSSASISRQLGANAFRMCRVP